MKLRRAIVVGAAMALALTVSPVRSQSAVATVGASTCADARGPAVFEGGPATVEFWVCVSNSMAEVGADRSGPWVTPSDPSEGCIYVETESASVFGGCGAVDSSAVTIDPARTYARIAFTVDGYEGPVSVLAYLQQDYVDVAGQPVFAPNVDLFQWSYIAGPDSDLSTRDVYAYAEAWPQHLATGWATVSGYYFGQPKGVNTIDAVGVFGEDVFAVAWIDP